MTNWFKFIVCLLNKKHTFALMIIQHMEENKVCKITSHWECSYCHLKRVYKTNCVDCLDA